MQQQPSVEIVRRVPVRFGPSGRPAGSRGATTLLVHDCAVLCTLGQGSFGEVLLRCRGDSAPAAADGRLVALKALSKSRLLRKREVRGVPAARGGGVACVTALDRVQSEIQLMRARARASSLRRSTQSCARSRRAAARPRARRRCPRAAPAPGARRRAPHPCRRRRARRSTRSRRTPSTRSSRATTGSRAAPRRCCSPARGGRQSAAWRSTRGHELIPDGSRGVSFFGPQGGPPTLPRALGH